MDATYYLNTVLLNPYPKWLIDDSLSEAQREVTADATEMEKDGY